MWVHILLEYIFLSISCVLRHLRHWVQRQTTPYPPAPFPHEGKGCKYPSRGSTIPRESCGCWIKVSMPCQGWWCRVPEPPPTHRDPWGTAFSFLLGADAGAAIPQEHSAHPRLRRFSATCMERSWWAQGEHTSSSSWPAKGFYFLPLKHHQSPPQTPAILKRC